MIKFEGKILQFGFGAVGKSFYEKLSKEINYNENNYYVITREEYEFEAYVNLGGLTTNFKVCEINKDNFKEIFSNYLSKGDLLIDFADTVGTKDICKWCAENNIMYINTGEADWPENWYSIFNENVKKQQLRKELSKLPEYNQHPIVLQHGNNPGLVSHFVKSAIEYIIKTQHKKDKQSKKLLKEHKFNKIAEYLKIKMIHVNDIDLQQVKEEVTPNKLISTWCIDSFFFELLSEATQNIGTHELIDNENECRLLDYEKGFLEYKDLAAETKCRTYYPNGYFEGYLVPHEETITIANYLEVKENDKVKYRPSVMFLYSPCTAAQEYLKVSKVNEYPNPDPNKPQDINNPNGTSIIRGHIYPNEYEIIYQEKISSGTEYVGVLLIGENFKPVWVGNRVEMPYLYKKKKDSYWQTPTITPVAASALAATCWMIKNKDKGGIYFPDEIEDYKYIIKLAEKYISKTIYKTFDRNLIEQELKIDFSNIQSKDFFVKEKE